MKPQIDKTKAIPGTTVFTAEQTRRGYRLNRFAMSLAQAANRDAFKADEEAYMEAYGLSETERRSVRERDFRALIDDCGGNIYMIMKIGTCTGHGLYQIGAQIRGETFEEFLASRNAGGAR